MLRRRDLLAGGLALDEVAERVLVAIVELLRIEMPGHGVDDVRGLYGGGIPPDIKYQRSVRGFCLGDANPAASSEGWNLGRYWRVRRLLLLGAMALQPRLAARRHCSLGCALHLIGGASDMVSTLAPGR
jgi:hypothetical protein